jgi:hypothetical protein
MNSGGGVVNDKHGSVNALFAMGSDSFYFFRSIITRSNTPDFSIGLTVRLPGKDLEWDGKGQIDVVSGRLVLVTNEGDEADAKAIEISPDPTALQLAVSKDIAANLNKMRITVIWAAMAIVLTIAMFH